MMLIKEDEHLQIGQKERSLIERIDEEPDLFRDITITEFAKRANTSISVVSRLIRKLHFKGYRDFQNYLSKQNNRELTNRIFIENNSLIIKDQDIRIKNYDHYFLSKTINILDYSNLNSLVHKLESSQKIWIIGHKNSYLSALDLTNSLINLGKPAFVTKNISDISWQSKYLTENDLVIFISENWKASNFYNLAEDLKTKNIPTAAITSINKFFISNTDFVVNFYTPSIKNLSSSYNSKIQELFINNLLIQSLVKIINKD